MKKLSMALALMVFLTCPALANDAKVNMGTMQKDIKKLIEKQDKLLEEMKEIKAELHKIKIRVTR